MPAGTVASIDRVGCEARTFCRNAPRPRSWRPTLRALAGAIPFAFAPFLEHRHGRIHDPTHAAGDHLASLRRSSRLLPPAVHRLRHCVLRRSARGAVLPIRLPPTGVSPPSSSCPTGVRNRRARLALTTHARFARVRPRSPVWPLDHQASPRPPNSGGRHTWRRGPTLQNPNPCERIHSDGCITHSPPPPKLFPSWSPSW